jgi:lipopolysaccharide transport system permease protein
VLGANLGSGFLGVLTTARSALEVRQVPVGNLVFKALGVLVAAPFVPLGLMTLGISMALAALGTYLRDTTHVVAGLLGGLIFLSPFFYPISLLPEKYGGIIMLHAITVAVEQIRAVLYHGQMIDWTQWSVYLLVSLVVASLGLWVFQRARVGFADVL